MQTLPTEPAARTFPTLEALRRAAQRAGVVACEFPIVDWNPIPVELPEERCRSYFGGRPWSQGHEQYRNLVRVPAYAGSAAEGSAARLETTPLLALASSSRSQLSDGRFYQASSVLLLWDDRSSGVVSLDWIDGNPSEGMVGREWHIHASKGVPVARGVEEFLGQSCVRPADPGCRRALYLTPAELGREAFGSEGQPFAGTPWQREWVFESFDALRAATGRFASELERLLGGVH